MWQYRGFIALQWVMERLPRRLGYALAIVVARVFERLIRAHPDDWYAFKPILREAPAA